MAKKSKSQESGIRRKKSVDMHCGFCMIYAQIPTEYRDARTKNRYCKSGGKEIDLETEACDNFDMTKIFWCRKTGSQMSPAECLTRLQKGQIPECHNCKQALELYRYLVVPPITFNIIGD